MKTKLYGREQSTIIEEGETCQAYWSSGSMHVSTGRKCRLVVVPCMCPREKMQVHMYAHLIKEFDILKHINLYYNKTNIKVSNLDRVKTPNWGVSIPPTDRDRTILQRKLLVHVHQFLNRKVPIQVHHNMFLDSKLYSLLCWDSNEPSKDNNALDTNLICDSAHHLL